MRKSVVKKPFGTLLGSGALSLLMGSALIGSTPRVAQTAEKPVPLTATILSADAADVLAWTQWELTSPTFEGANKTPFLNFTDSQLSAGVGLNAIGGDYSIKGRTISFGKLLSTRMAGPAELMQAEDRFSKALSSVRKFEISPDGENLVLRGGQTLTFRFKSRAPQGFIPTETKIINVAPQFGPQMDGDKTPKYLQIEDLSPRISWGRFTEAKIEGFQFEPGYHYQLCVVVERNPRTNEKRLRMLEIFSQQWMETSPLAANQKILEVAPTRIDCSDAMPMQCLQVRELGGEWQTMRAPISGFAFQPGWRYRLQVEVMPVENAADDASAVRYTQVRLLDKMPVTY